MRRLTPGGDGPTFAIESAVVAFAVVLVLPHIAGVDVDDVLLVPITLSILLSSWGLAVISYALHYAQHDADAPGLEFPGTRTNTFADYRYFAVAVATTFGATDVNITTPTMRRIVNVHTVLTFVYNSVIVALLWRRSSRTESTSIVLTEERMNAYDSEPWREFAVGTGGAAAALVGLLFVAISINLQAIIKLPHIPIRAAHALVVLATPVFLALILLIPQEAVPLGIEMIVAAVIAGPLVGWLAAPTHRSRDTPPAAWALLVIGPAVALALGPLLAGIGVLTTSLGGLYWIPAAMVVALLSGLFNAWVLMIEIIR